MPVVPYMILILNGQPYPVELHVLSVWALLITVTMAVTASGVDSNRRAMQVCRESERRKVEGVDRWMNHCGIARLLLNPTASLAI